MYALLFCFKEFDVKKALVYKALSQVEQSWPKNIWPDCGPTISGFFLQVSVADPAEYFCQASLANKNTQVCFQFYQQGYTIANLLNDRTSKHSFA